MRMLLTALLVAFAGPAASQTGQPPGQVPAPKTKIEAFTGTSGSVVIKGYTDVGQLDGGSIEVTAMTFRNPNDKQQTSGLAISVKDARNPAYNGSKRSFVDYDEIQGLLEGIKYISSSKKDVTKLQFFETSYSTRGDLRLVTFNDGAGNISATVDAGPSYSKAQTFVSLGQLSAFAALIESGKKILDEAR